VSGLSITVHRRRSDGQAPTEIAVVSPGAPNVDFAVAERRLREELRTAQAGRGTSPWADADPEVHVSGTFNGRLARGGDIEALVQQAVGQFRADVAASTLRMHPLTPAAVNSLGETFRQEAIGVYLFFRARRPDDGEPRTWNGMICLRVGKTPPGLLGHTVFEATRNGAGCEATHFAFKQEALALVVEAEHRRLYEAFQPVLGDAPDGT
jgi:hypothetical protein